MKKIYLNLKRFDIPKDMNGINDIGYGDCWARKIINSLNSIKDVDLVVFLPESSLFSAIKNTKHIGIGCQGVHYKDVVKGGNFGAFTSFRPASAMKALGVTNVIVGHSEERASKNELLIIGGGKGDVNEILNQEVKCALAQEMKVLYCVGEKAEEQENKYEVIKNQILVGLKDVDISNISIAYEPIWAIGPGKVPPDKEYIEDIVKFIKSVVNVPVVYGGGLKVENAQMLASISELDGGLVALTRFGKDFGFSTDDFKKIVETYKEGL